MAQPPKQAVLTPSLCFSPGALREFLRFSRSQVDDAIALNLNSLVTPAKAGFDPQSTSQRSLPPSPHPQISSQTCRTFKHQLLFPAWQARAQLLDYCEQVANNPDPTDPDAAQRESEMQRDRERIVDERLDPYSGQFHPRESRAQALASLVRQERRFEKIVRDHSWGVLQNRGCAAQHESWETAVKHWELPERS